MSTSWSTTASAQSTSTAVPSTWSFGSRTARSPSSGHLAAVTHWHCAFARTDEERARTGAQGGIEPFGIHLANRSAWVLDAAVEKVLSAGGRLLDRGQHASGSEYAYVTDLDGYIIEL